jgi:putative membrane protein insertion efficiency factor
MRRFFLLLIRAYQKTLSPDHGMTRFWFPHGYCRFHPSCSQYGHDAIARYGVVRGGIKAAYRIVRCNPWNPGGHDPVS